MRLLIAVLVGFFVSSVSRIFRIGAGATWPGEIAMRIDPDILSELSKKPKMGTVLVAGTNGKTTTVAMIRSIASAAGMKVLTNESGANLINGLVSAYVARIRNVFSPPDLVVFEVDENNLPEAVRLSGARAVVLGNVFRDQLDRYGEVDAILSRWSAMVDSGDRSVRYFVNADDPGLAHVGSRIPDRVTWFGLEDSSLYLPSMQHATDSIYCPRCGKRLTYGGTYFSHLGKWSCGGCGFTHPDVRMSAKDVVSPLPGVYNIYNTIAATLVARSLGIPADTISVALSRFSPAFGRMETLMVDGVKVKILLSKNPTGFNESLRTALADPDCGSVLLVLNDRIPDGRDVSWIWDVDFEQLRGKDVPVTVSGDRTYDMAVRIRHALSGERSLADAAVCRADPDLKSAVSGAVKVAPPQKTVWILATYSGMLEVREILTGRKIL